MISLNIFKRLITHIFPYKLKLFFNKVINKCYSYWILNFIGDVGKHVTVERGCELRGGKYISIGSGTTIGRNSILSCYDYHRGLHYAPSLSFGKDCHIGDHTHVSCAFKITIGNNLLTGRRCYISDNNHGKFDKESLLLPPIERSLSSKGNIVIGNNVWLGERVTILSGVHIGDGVIVAANAVVTHDIPSYSLAAGVPAQIIKQL